MRDVFCIGIIVSTDNNIMWMVADKKKCVAIDATNPRVLERAICIDFESMDQNRLKCCEKNNHIIKESGYSSTGPMIFLIDQIMTMPMGEPRELLAVLTTHWHSDHSSGDEYWRAQGVDVYDHKKALNIKKNKNQNENGIFDVSFTIQDFIIDVIFTPCHTRDSMCFLINKKWVFTGDTLFYLGCGRFFEGDASDMQKNFDKIMKLDGDVICCYGHDYSRKNMMFVKKYHNNIYNEVDYKDNDRAKESGGIIHSNMLTIFEERKFNPFINAKKYNKTLKELRDEKDLF